MRTRHFSVNQPSRLERLRAVPGVRGVTTWTHLSTLKEDYAGHAR